MKVIILILLLVMLPMVTSLQESGLDMDTTYYLSSGAENIQTGDMDIQCGIGQQTIGETRDNIFTLSYGIFYQELEDTIDIYYGTLRFALYVIDKSLEWAKLGWY